MSHRREHEQALLRRVEHLFERVANLLEELRNRLPPHQPITAFQIKETTMEPTAPGTTHTFTAAPVPANATISNPPTWTSSDTTNAPITVDSTGLIATVEIPANAVVGKEVTLTITDTNPDSTQASGTFTFTIAAPPPVDITSFTITQTT